MREGTERNILADASKVVKKNKSVKWKDDMILKSASRDGKVSFFPSW